MKFKQFVSNCLDDQTKAKTKLNRNYFYVATVFFIALNICIWALAGTALHDKFVPKDNFQSWDDVFNLKALFSAIINNLSHWDWNHVLLNMIPSFLVVSLYLERKYGSLKYFLIVTTLIVVSAAFVGCTHQSLNYAGFSCVNFALFAFFIVTFFFSLSKRNWSKGNYIFGIVIFMAVLVFMTWEIWQFDKSGSAADLAHNMGHYAGFLSGLVVGLVVNVTKVFTRKDCIQTPPNLSQRMTKSTIVIYGICLAINISLAIATTIISIVSVV